jgi:hypothetical protein
MKMYIYSAKIPTWINKWVVFIVREYVFDIGETADNCIAIANKCVDWCK